jgi:hypothetical protein
MLSNQVVEQLGVKESGHRVSSMLVLGVGG